MILKRLAINRLPGIDQPFEIEAAEPGIHVIFGPNGIGKSSICRAVEGLYWGDRGSSRKTSVNGEFEWDGETWRGEREGSTVRWSRGDEGNVSPNLPPSHNYRCFFLHLRDLVDPSLESTVDIASEIRRQMSGGFDLDGIASDLFPPVTRNRSRRERNRFNDALTGVQRAEAEQSGLQQRVDQLEELKTQLEEAENAASRLTHVDRAIGLAKRRNDLAGIKEQFKALPGALENLTGKECDDVEEHQKQLTTLEERARELESELHQARAKQKESGLVSSLDQADLATWRDQADELVRIEQELEAAKTDHEKARKKLASALAAIGGDNIDNPALSLPDHGELFEFLRASHSHDTRVGAIRERLRLFEGLDPPEESEQDIDKFRNAAEALRSWLRVSQRESLAVRLRSRRPWLVLAFALLSAGAGLAYLIDPLLAAIAGMGAGIGLAAWFLGNERGSLREGLAAQATYEDLGLEEPAHWDVPSVGSALRSLESKIARLEASLKRARDRDVERNSLKNQLNGLVDDKNTLETRRQELQATLGLEKLPPDAELVDFARALDQLRLARGEYEAATGKVQGLKNSHTGKLTELAHILEHHGEPQPAGAAAAKARLNKLSDRNSRLEKALADERQAKGQLEQNTADGDSTLASISRIYAEAGLGDGDLHGLTSLLGALPQYHGLKKQRTGLRSQIELDRTELKKAGESGLSDLDGQSLEQLKKELAHAAPQARDLRNGIADVTALTKQARRGNNMQDLIAAREEARANLQDLRDEALFATAGDFLVGDVEQEYEQTRMPRVFERARDHFSLFTFHNYELRLEKGDGSPRLFATDLIRGQKRELDELSDGTRAQLLLAARIAFAEEVEQGKVLPLFLDEALDQSDPQRFEAIVQSLGRVALDQGRQIFYLTSDPLDVDRIRNALDKESREIAAAIDLGRIRTGAETVSGPQALTVDPPPAIPAPGGRSSEEYGAALAVPAFRPALGFAQQHMFYILWDDMELLHDFLTNGIERAGQWKTVSDTLLAERLGSRSIAAEEISLRLDLLDVYCELWKQGRGRPVDIDTLHDSGILTQRYLDVVAAITKELAGDPEQLLAVLAGRQDPRLKGFRMDSVERLRNYLAEHQYLDERPVLTERELRLHALATPAANKLGSSVANACVQRWWSWTEKSEEQPVH